MKKHTHSNEEPNIISKWLFKYGNEIIRKNTEEKLEKLMKEQEIKEAAERYAEDDPYNRYEKCFINGVKWHQKRSYSEEDMMFAYEQGARLALISQSQLSFHKGEFPTPKEWFEQFKKK